MNIEDVPLLADFELFGGNGSTRGGHKEGHKGGIKREGRTS